MRSMTGWTTLTAKTASSGGAEKLPASNIVTQHVCSGSEASWCAAACIEGDAAIHSTASKCRITAKPIARGKPDRCWRGAVMKSGRIYACCPLLASIHA